MARKGGDGGRGEALRLTQVSERTLQSPSASLTPNDKVARHPKRESPLPPPMESSELASVGCALEAPVSSLTLWERSVQRAPPPPSPAVLSRHRSPYSLPDERRPGQIPKSPTRFLPLGRDPRCT